ncbi:MAG: alpha/beta hydrolase [Deltaproteobacteria bacterium]|nr:alpha/beta hydrolase [Deltaproteobacteria bacterium]
MNLRLRTEGLRTPDSSEPRLPSGWHPSRVEAPKGAVLVSHGLNCSPGAMGAFVEVLTRAGFHVLQLAFRTCRAPAERSSFHELWLEDFAAGYARLRELSQGLPRYHLGFSLGGLVGTAFLQRDPAARFERVVLLAPALSLRPAASILRLLVPLGSLGLSLPSFCPARYRNRRSTPLAEYRALLRLVREVEDLRPGTGAATIPTKVLMEPRDELVSYRGVKRWVQRNGSPGWCLELVRLDRQLGLRRPHLLLDELAVGSSCWARLTREILEHFEG